MQLGVCRRRGRRDDHRVWRRSCCACSQARRRSGRAAGGPCATACLPATSQHSGRVRLSRKGAAVMAPWQGRRQQACGGQPSSLLNELLDHAWFIDCTATTSFSSGTIRCWHSVIIPCWAGARVIATGGVQSCSAEEEAGRGAHCHHVCPLAGTPCQGTVVQGSRGHGPRG